MVASTTRAMSAATALLSAGGRRLDLVFGDHGTASAFGRRVGPTSGSPPRGSRPCPASAPDRRLGRLLVRALCARRRPALRRQEPRPANRACPAFRFLPRAPATIASRWDRTDRDRPCHRRRQTGPRRRRSASTLAGWSAAYCVRQLCQDRVWILKGGPLVHGLTAPRAGAPASCAARPSRRPSRPQPCRRRQLRAATGAAGGVAPFGYCLLLCVAGGELHQVEGFVGQRRVAVPFFAGLAVC